MKKKIVILSIGLFIGALFLSSCHAKRGGIVPCPSHGQIDIPNNSDLQKDIKQL